MASIKFRSQFRHTDVMRLCHHGRRYFDGGGQCRLRHSGTWQITWPSGKGRLGGAAMDLQQIIAMLPGDLDQLKQAIESLLFVESEV
jgi:hypothetical protein